MAFGPRRRDRLEQLGDARKPVLVRLFAIDETAGEFGAVGSERLAEVDAPRGAGRDLDLDRRRPGRRSNGGRSTGRSRGPGSSEPRAPTSPSRHVEAGQKGDRIKSKYAIDPVEAEIVRFIFELAVKGDGQSDPLGVKRIADTLDERGIRMRKDNFFTTGGIHEISTREAAAGTQRRNVRSNKIDEFKCDTEMVAYEVTVIAEREVFDRVRQLLADRDRAPAALDRILASETSVRTIDPMKVQIFSSAMATTLSASDVGARKARVDAPVDRIAVEKTDIRVIGKKDLLARAIDRGRDLPAPPDRVAGA